ncbi:MAG: magnesium transporter CorA family protein [Endomicrobiales bacterium]
MIRAIYVKNGDSATETRIENIPGILEQKPRLFWLDITIENNEFSNDELALLAESFKFHDLSIEDCLFPQYHPKVEEFENYVFAAVHGIRVKVNGLADFDDALYELDLFIGKDFVVTVHTGELFIIDNIFQKAKLKPQVELKTLENLLYNIFQKIVASFEFTLDKLGDRFDSVEDRVLENPTTELMAEIFTLKKVLLNLRKITEPQQNVYTYFTRETTGFISKKFTAYFRDIFFQYDHINQSISSLNQMIGSMLEIYVSGATLKLNEVMKFLTIIATVLLPAVLIASYYGMNVSFPEHRIFGNENVWYFVAALIAASTLGVYFYLKRKKWF